MSAFWQMIVVMVVKALMDWFTSQDDEKAKAAGAKIAVAKKAYEEKSAEINTA